MMTEEKLTECRKTIGGYWKLFRKHQNVIDSNEYWNEAISDMCGFSESNRNRFSELICEQCIKELSQIDRYADRADEKIYYNVFLDAGNLIKWTDDGFGTVEKQAEKMLKKYGDKNRFAKEMLIAVMRWIAEEMDDGREE